MGIFTRAKFSPHRRAKNRGKTKGLSGATSAFKGSGIRSSIRHGRHRRPRM